MTAPCVDGTVKLDRSAEEALRLEAERVGGLAIDPDEATRGSDAYNFLADCRVILVAAEGGRATSFDEARELLGVAVAELESSPDRDLLAPHTTGARELLTTTPDDARTAADDLRAVAVALPVLAAGLYWARQRQLS